MANIKLPWLRRFLSLDYSIASSDTFERVFAALDPTSFERAFREWVAEVIPTLDQEQAIAIDGKRSRCTTSKAAAVPLHMVSAFAAEFGLVNGSGHHRTRPVGVAGGCCRPVRQVLAPGLLATCHRPCHSAGNRGTVPPVVPSGPCRLVHGTVSRVLCRTGLSRLSDLQPEEPVQRYEREAPGKLLHIDIKRLGRFDRIGHGITGDRIQSSRSIGWEFLFVAIDDHSRIAFTRMYPDERKESAVSCVLAATQYFAGLRITIERVITDNGSAFRSHAFRVACNTLGIRQKLTRAYRGTETTS